MKNVAIILASGSGERTGLSKPKQFIKIAGKTVLEHTLNTFEKNNNIDEIIVVSHINYIGYVQDIVIKNNYKKISKILSGGTTRQESSYIGINSITGAQAKVLIHDAVRPFISNDIIDNCLQKLDEYKAVDVAIDSADTLIAVDNNNLITSIPKRDFIKRGQTPQAFDLAIIRRAHELASKEQNVDVTDDCGLVLKYNLCDIYVIKGDDFNHKITYPIDIAIADKLFQLRNIYAASQDKNLLKNKVIVVFGASKGIGRAVVELSNQYNAKVYGFSRSGGTDVCNYKDIKIALEQVAKTEGKIDIVINTAGVLRMGQLNTRDLEDIYQEININYVGCINIARLAYKYLQASKGSLIFFTSSSYTRGRALYSVYSSTKSALVNLIQALAEEWEKDAIRVNIINPERTATPMRLKNFGIEPKESLLSPQVVADTTLNTALSDYTGQVIDIKISQIKS